VVSPPYGESLCYSPHRGTVTGKTGQDVLLSSSLKGRRKTGKQQRVRASPPPPFTPGGRQERHSFSSINKGLPGTRGGSQNALCGSPGDQKRATERTTLLLGHSPVIFLSGGTKNKRGRGFGKKRLHWTSLYYNVGCGAFCAHTSTKFTMSGQFRVSVQGTALAALLYNQHG